MLNESKKKEKKDGGQDKVINAKVEACRSSCNEGKEREKKKKERKKEEIV